MDKANEYGDLRSFLSPHHGIDVASQREDDLDRFASERIRLLSSERQPVALDVACGAGGQALRMALAGARVIAIDVAPLGEIFQEAMRKASEQAGRGGLAAEFFWWDMRKLPDSPAGSLEDKVDVIVCQRAIHYFPHEEAVTTVSAMARCLVAGGQLYISASGLDSELSKDYAAANELLSGRFAPLSMAMAKKHGIYHPVCLYSISDMEQLLRSAGLEPRSIFESSFGNIKAIARKIE